MCSRAESCFTTAHLTDRQCYRSIPFNNSFSASNSSFESVTPLPIFSPSADQSRMSYLASRSFQLTRLSSFDQPEPALDSVPIFFTISYLISAMVSFSFWGCSVRGAKQNGAGSDALRHSDSL